MNDHPSSAKPDAKQQPNSVWYLRLPDPMVLIFIILVATAALTYVIPAGEFKREIVDGITKVDPDSYQRLASNPTSPFAIFVAVPRGLLEAGQYLFIVFIAGGLFHLLKVTGALENAVGSMIKRAGQRNQAWVIWTTTFVFGFFGAAVGFENNLGLVPIGAMIGHTLARSALLGAGMAVGGIGIGFALSPINPYTVGVAQGIAELDTFSGAGLRTVLLLTCLSLLAYYLTHALNRGAIPSTQTANEDASLTRPLEDYTMHAKDYRVLAIFVGGMACMLYGVFKHGWYINEIAGVFLAIAVAIGITERIGANRFVAILMTGAASVTSGALVIGVAAAIKILLDDARITDTLVQWLSSFLDQVPVMFSAVLMTLVQGIINFFIPGGSGQALVTMPIMVPLGDITGMSRQVTVLAFQVGDGLTNLVLPTSGGTLAMLALVKVGYSEWFKFILPVVLGTYLISWAFIVLAVLVGY